MAKLSKRKYLQLFLERILAAQSRSHQPESFDQPIAWARQRLEQPSRKTPKAPRPTRDADLSSLSQKSLRHEVQRLRDAIRLHRDERGHQRCWLDDERLYRVLPEQTKAEFILPPREEFLTRCALYWQERQPNPL